MNMIGGEIVCTKRDISISGVLKSLGALSLSAMLFFFKNNDYMRTRLKKYIYSFKSDFEKKKNSPDFKDNVSH